MEWSEQLSLEQVEAARHAGSNAVLIAGPGTGKTRTVTRRIIRLCQVDNVKPSEILLLTFTRFAAAILRVQAKEALGSESEIPEACTLHSYALSQLIRSGEDLTTLPTPIRIADDWEERHIVLEDLRRWLEKKEIKEVSRLFAQLSADWQTLDVDGAHWRTSFPDPKFLTAWETHRTTYGYSMRDELVYQLKRATEEIYGFRLPNCPRYLFVDEYQDLNQCDLAIVRAICRQGAELFAAGDDDQSIYGFRHAFPLGIRQFHQDYPGSRRLDLTECHRCEQPILEVAQFLADRDPSRLKKSIVSVCPPVCGDVRLLNFEDEQAEAVGVARVCRFLIDTTSQRPGEILILLRSDRNGAFSDQLAGSLATYGLEASVRVDTRSPIDGREGRILLGFLRLLLNSEDSLAWRTIIDLRQNGIGAATVDALSALAGRDGRRFVFALRAVKEEPHRLEARGAQVANEVKAIEQILLAMPPLPDAEDTVLLSQWLAGAAPDLIQEQSARDHVLTYLQGVIDVCACASVPQLLNALAMMDERMEQELDSNVINIMTMHKAKGLSADVVFVVAAEDEYIPGRAAADEFLVGDELRLLYVSLTRARHRLYMTYCRERGGQQTHTGRTAGSRSRTLCRFLKNGPVHAESGPEYVRQLGATRDRATGH